METIVKFQNVNTVSLRNLQSEHIIQYKLNTSKCRLINSEREEKSIAIIYIYERPRVTVVLVSTTNNNVREANSRA